MTKTIIRPKPVRSGSILSGPVTRATGVDTWDAQRALHLFEANLRRFEEHRDFSEIESSHSLRSRSCFRQNHLVSGYQSGKRALLSSHHQ
jgi:hypothetical protein